MYLSEAERLTETRSDGLIWPGGYIQPDHPLCGFDGRSNRCRLLGTIITSTDLWRLHCISFAIKLYALLGTGNTNRIGSVIGTTIGSILVMALVAGPVIRCAIFLINGTGRCVPWLMYVRMCCAHRWQQMISGDVGRNWRKISIPLSWSLNKTLVCTLYKGHATLTPSGATYVYTYSYRTSRTSTSSCRTARWSTWLTPWKAYKISVRIFQHEYQ